MHAGQYLLLGSVSLDLLQQSGETLAGRIAADTLRRFWTMLAHQQGGLLIQVAPLGALCIELTAVSSV